LSEPTPSGAAASYQTRPPGVACPGQVINSLGHALGESLRAKPSGLVSSMWQPPDARECATRGTRGESGDDDRRLGQCR
jgi:hypothetical protein